MMDDAVYGCNDDVVRNDGEREATGIKALVVSRKLEGVEG
jgi:hypothetical protein